MALKILLADDSMTAQNMGKKILVDAGYEVVAVSNGAAAIKKISSERPDIAILDEYMPGYMGSEVCERVKASAETSKIPVLLTVGKMEPFDQQRANKVRADGVMIKPFEASDLIAAIQSIAQRLLSSTPAPRSGNEAPRLGGKPYIDTLRVPPPVPSEPDHEDTLRLTAEQIKAFQDASYREWADTAEREQDPSQTPSVAEPSAEMTVTPPVQEAAEAVPALAPEVAEVDMPIAAAAIDIATGSHETPVFSAMAASGVAAEHEIFAASTSPIAPLEEAASAPAEMPALYTPAVVEPAEQAATPVFAVQPEPVTPAIVEPVLADEPAPFVVPSVAKRNIEAIVEPVIHSVVEAASADEVHVAPIFDPSAPLAPGPLAVLHESELEHPVAATAEVATTAAHELEINSPPQERGPAVAQDPGLVTEAEDMAQFVTKFGAASADPIHVGVATDLPAEQLAAIVTPVEDTPVAPEQAVVPEHVVPEAVVETPVVETIQAVLPDTIEPSPAVHDPSLDDTQDIRAFEEEETVVAAPADEPVVEAAIIAQPQEPVFAAQPMSSFMPVEPVSAIEEPAIPAEPAIVPEAVAAPVQVVQPAVEAEAEPQPAEMAFAAIAAGAAISIPQVYESPSVSSPVETTSGQRSSLEPAVSESYGDAVLAEQLAAALSQKQAEEQAKAAEELAPTAAPPDTGAESQTAPDSKLAEAVARAFEHLKPQLITEIIKELGK